MGWSERYKKSINCDNPKGFSQRAHCQGRKKKMNEGKEKQDHEVSMAKTQVKKSIDNLQKVARVLAKKTDADNLPAWVQAKLTDTEHNTSAAADYMGEEKKKCGDGEYWCKTDEKCKKVPKGHHVMGNGDLMKDSEHEESGDVSEQNANDPRYPIGQEVGATTLQTVGKNLRSNRLKRNTSLKVGVTNKVPSYSDGKVANPDEVFEQTEYLEEKKKGGTLHNWFKKSKSKDGKPGWVQSDGSPCANEPGETKTPKCYSSRRLAGLKKTEEGKKKIRSADARKSRKDSGQQQKSGGAAPTMVRTFTDKKDYKKHKSGDYSAESFEMQEARDVKGKGSGKKDACYHKVKSRYSVWPSAYASGALVKCRKVGAANWGTKSESFQYSNWREDFKALEIETIDLIKAEPLISEGQKCWKGYEKKGTKKMFGKTYNNCVKKEGFSNWREELAEAKIDKSKMKCNKPKAQAVGDSLTGKSHVVKACEGGKEKIIRFGQRGVKGSPKKKGESKEYASRRHRFQTRHAKNIAKGKMSAAYWANKVKW